MLELIDELIPISDSFEILWWSNCDLIKYKDLLVIVMGSDNKIKQR